MKDDGMNETLEMIRYRFVQPDGRLIFTWIEPNQLGLTGVYEIGEGCLWIGSNRFVGPWRLERSTDGIEWHTIDDSDAHGIERTP